MEIVDTILQNVASPLTALFGGLTSLIISLVVFREQLIRLLSMLPQPLVQLLSNITVVRVALGRYTFQIDFGQQVQRAKARAKGVEATVAASRSMPAPNLLRDRVHQSSRDIVLAAWGALQQIVYDACIASKIPLTPATRVPEAVRRLAEAHAITAEVAYLIDVLYRLGQGLADDPALRPLEADGKVYTELADLVVDWLMLHLLSLEKDGDSQPVEDPKPRRKTVVGGHFAQPRPGFPAMLLVGIGGPVRGQRFAVEKEHYRMGSHSDNDLRITGDAYVSGNHASLRYEKGSLFLFDQGSRNGSFLNEKPVAGTPVVVRQGDQIRLGESVFQVADMPT